MQLFSLFGNFLLILLVNKIFQNSHQSLADLDGLQTVAYSDDRDNLCDVGDRIIMLVYFFNVKNRSLTSQTCHQITSMLVTDVGDQMCW